MLKKYIFILTSICFSWSTYAQAITEEFYDDEQTGYVAHDIAPTVADVNTSLNQFKKDITLSDDENALIQAAFSNNVAVADKLLKQGVNPNIIYNVQLDNGTTYKTSLLHIIIAGNDRDILDRLLSCDNVSVNQLGFSSLNKNNKIDYVEISPLAYAVYLNHKPIVEKLLNMGSDVNLYGKGSYSAIFYAQDEKILKLLSKYNADFNILINDTRPLFEAVKSNNSQLVKMLLNNGADINKKDGLNKTLLYTAISNGYYELARFLIDNGANIDEPSGENKITPLMATLERDDHDTGFIRYLIFKGANVNSTDVFNRTPFFYACKYDNQTDVKNVVESIDILMENNANVNSQDNNGNTILHIKPNDYYKIFAKYNININIQNKEGNTPLHMATMQDNITSLLTGSPNRTIKNTQGKTALDIAIEKKYKNTSELLKLTDEQSLLMLGAKMGDNLLVEKALEKKIDVNQEILGKLPVYYAAKGGNIDVFIQLMTAGAKLDMVPDLVYDVIGNFTDSKDQVSRVELSKILIDEEVAIHPERYSDFLHILAREQSEKNMGQGYIRTILAYAISKGIDPNKLDSKGDAPIHIVAKGQYESYDLMLELISGGANVDIADKNGLPAIYYCANAPYNKNDVFLALLNNTKTDLNKTYGVLNNTLLMEAAMQGNANIVMMLIARGADDTIKNKDGKTALMLAKETFKKKYDNATVEEKNSSDYKNYKFLADVFLSDKNTVAECRSGINETCKKYYKAVEIIKTTN